MLGSLGCVTCRALAGGCRHTVHDSFSDRRVIWCCKSKPRRADAIRSLGTATRSYPSPCGISKCAPTLSRPPESTTNAAAARIAASSQPGCACQGQLKAFSGAHAGVAVTLSLVTRPKILMRRTLDLATGHFARRDVCQDRMDLSIKTAQAQQSRTTESTYVRFMPCLLGREEDTADGVSRSRVKRHSDRTLGSTHR